MAKYKPNVVSLNRRLALAICVVFLLIFALAELATGYTYVLGKRGGYLLSGIPTLMIALSASALCAAAMLMIIDHYDKRENESSYAATRAACLKASLYLFLAALFVELLRRILLLLGFDIIPDFHGFAENYTFFSPELSRFIRYLDPILSNGLLIGLLSFAACGLGGLVSKYFPNRAKRPVVLLISAGMLGLSVLYLATSTESFFLGEVMAGSTNHKYTVSAEREPAKFNAILLTHFVLGGFMFTASALTFVGFASGRLNPK